MNQKPSEHLARVGRLRQAFAGANERLVARLRRATDAAAERAPDGRWSAARIGWHVAAVTNRFAGLISGDIAGAHPLPEGYRERPWAEIAAAIPERIETPAALVPPAIVRRADAVSALEASGMRMARAFDALTEPRGRGFGITNKLVGTISLYQLGDWATAHIIRHNKQAKERIGQ
ncbi:MAG: hypothetical protein A3H96_17500 [Acidobacteria bacterium RIFCSPLOWO2_02_FULL_67_36]|nr:MAG: hypothetical protein A3H96_17500 [Acidobacteria bacterium RIFCSPLOWO2_02_FULL_67_36]OFW25809.1 MAG: hypothetical protein A3G21_25385 [Acidobacteria bacterium RIFCSPLOWO2_12_FULL_66_21]